MNLFLKLLMLLIIFILLCILLRVIFYNNYITKINELHTNKFEHFTEQSKKAIKLNSNFIDKINSNAVIFTTIMGNLFIITSDYVYNLTNGKLSESPTREFLNLNINDTIDIKGGFFNHLNGIVYIFDSSYAYLFCLNSNKIVNKILKSKLFGFEIVEDIKNVLIFFSVYVIFTEKNIFYCDVITEKILDKKRENKIKNLFDKLPDNISNCFNNFSHIYYGIPVGTPTFLKNNKIYYIDLKLKEVIGPRSIENGFISNTKSKMYKDNFTNLNLVDSEKYRIYLFGAGIENGGLGGMIFNDFVIKPKSKISFISGSSGKRVPVRGESSKDKLSEIYSHSLPFNGSCSGSGCSIFILNNNTELVAGGGGGWCSEQVKSPALCNSVKYSLQDNGKKIVSSKIILPLKKIIIITESSIQNERCKLLINELNIDIFNQDDIKLDVQEYPKSSLNKTKIYETNYSEYGKSAKIEIIFNKPISDYKIKLNYYIESTANKDFVNSKIIFIDEQYRKYVIQNFNYVFNYKYITGDSIMRFVKKIASKKDIVHLKNQNFITDGCDTYGDIKNIHEHQYMLKNYDINPNEGENRYLLLEGGVGGGGHSLVDRKQNNIVCSGGGGYMGGKTSAIDSIYNIEYAAGSGGTSYINDISYKGEWLDDCENLFCNAINNSNGYMVIQSIKELPTHNIYKKKYKNNANNNITYNNKNNDNKNDVDKSDFFNKNIEKFADFNNYLNKPKFSSLIDYIDTYDFSEGNITSNKNIEIIEKDIVDLNINKLISNTSSQDLNELFYAFEADKPFSLVVIGWNNINFTRILISKKDNKQIYLKDDITQLDHSFNELTKDNMEQYLIYLIQNNIWKNKNSLITSKSNYVSFSQQLNNKNNIDGFVSLNFDKFSKIYFMLKFDDNKTNKNIKFVFNQFNKNKQNKEYIKESTLHYLEVN